MRKRREKKKTNKACYDKRETAFLDQYTLREDLLKN